MVLATLQTLPAEHVEAARMDGADAWRVFGHIVLPYIAPVLLVCTLFRLIDSIKAFPLIFLLTGGGPGSVTEVTNYYAYLVAFNFGELGYSSAITVVLLAATVLISDAVLGRAHAGLSGMSTRVALESSRRAEAGIASSALGRAARAAC